MQLTTTSTYTTVYGFTVKAKGANTGKVYLGFDNTVTADTTAATDGFELSAGEAYFVPKAEAADPTGVWVIASTTNQEVFVRGG